MSVPERRWAIVPAAGRGERFGGRVPKQYTLLLGRPMLSWSLEVLLAEPAIDGVVVAVARGDRRWHTLPESRDPRVRTCVGGPSRESSVARALAALSGTAEDADWVVVHDAARPCLRGEDLRALILGTADDGVGGLLAAPVSDTLKRDDGHARSAHTVTREGLWRALTPQCFRYALLGRALRLCLDRERRVTDEASAIEALGLRPRLVRGRNDNIKVTDPEDAELAAALLAAWGRRHEGGLGVRRSRVRAR